MKAKIIRIGNSKGLRLRKTLLEKYKIDHTVELIMKENHIEIHPSSDARAGWSEKFMEMNRLSDDELLIPDVFEDEVEDV